MESRHVVKLPRASQPSSIVTFQGSPVQDLKGFRLHQRRTLCDNTTVSITLFEICISIHLSIQSFMSFQNSYPTKSQLENHEWKHILWAGRGMWERAITWRCTLYVGMIECSTFLLCDTMAKPYLVKEGLMR